jgi:pilus assembly protein CpaB
MMMLARISPIYAFGIILTMAAGVTMYLSSEMARHNPPRTQVAAEPAKQKVAVLFAARDLQEGAIINADDVAVRQIEMDRAPVDVLNDSDGAIGRTLKFPVAAGTLISNRDLTPLGIASNTFQAKLRSGERAITLAVDSTTGVAGFIAPDSHVDVMVQVGSGADTKVRPILSDARVVASGTIYQKSATGGNAVPASTVTVAVEPGEAAKLISAMAAGRIYLTLRSDRDHTPIAVSDINSLFPKAKPAIIAEAQLPPLPPPPQSAQAMPPEEPTANPMHEVELFAGSRKDVVTTARQ